MTTLYFDVFGDYLGKDGGFLALAFLRIQETTGEYGESCPNYESEPRIEELIGTLERIKNDQYYPDIFDKAAYMFLSVCKGHFFSNGNKRLAVSLLLIFMILNGYNIDKDAYQILVEKIKIKDPDSVHYFFYNLALAVLDEDINNEFDFDELKALVKTILQGSFHKN